MRARKRLAALLIAGALSAPMLSPAPASAQGLLDLSNLLATLGGGTGGLTGLLGTGGGTGGLAGVLGAGALNDLLQGSSLLNQCGLALGLLDPATCLTASTLPTTTGLTGLSPLTGLPLTTGIPSLGTGLGFPQVIPVPVGTANQPIVVTNNNASSSSSSAAAAAAPGGGASATATGNSNSNQSQTIVIP